MHKDNKTHYITYMFLMDAKYKQWRIQTNDPKIIRKLRKRDNMRECAWFINSKNVMFQTAYFSTKEALKSIKRLTGQKVEKDPTCVGFFAKSGVILDKKHTSLDRNEEINNE